MESLTVKLMEMLLDLMSLESKSVLMLDHWRVLEFHQAWKEILLSEIRLE